MATTDRYGLPVTTASPAAAERLQDGMDRLLAYGPGAEQAFAAALQVDDGLALAHAGVALVAVVQGDAARARDAVGRAQATVAGASRRERQHVEAVSALVGGETARGLGLVDEHVKDFPRDALLVNQAGSAIGFAGRPDREEQRMRFLERLAPAYGDDWWFQSALAFTYHEVDRYEDSRRLSERSLSQYPGNAGASHNLAHIYFETLDTDAGATFLADWMAGYDARASFHCHLAWHLAMFELHRGRYAQALDIFERDVVAAVNPRLAMIDGAALLWRFRLDGQDGGSGRPLAWRPLAELAERVSRPGFVFGEIHAALAYAASGDQTALTRLMDGLRALHAKGHPIAGTVALPIVQGVAAFVAGDHAGALAHFEPVEGEMHRVGGSHAQWELFEETMVASYLALERFDAALRLVRRRLLRRASPRDQHWLDRANAGLAAQPTA
jgi:tetratricopeptide (TPR) repeat protein